MLSQVVVSRLRYPDYILHVEPFVRPHEAENPLREVVKEDDLHCMEVAHDTGNISKHVESSVNMARQEFRVRYLGDDIAQCSI